MSEDRRVGKRISETEYLEVFVVTPGIITVQVRKDHGLYWLLSRESFSVAVQGVDTRGYRFELTDSEFQQVTTTLRDQIDTTRALLGNRLIAH